jgi:hypothetical protein
MEEDEIPEEFIRAMEDYEAGRTVDMETAMREVPPSAAELSFSDFAAYLARRALDEEEERSK